MAAAHRPFPEPGHRLSPLERQYQVNIAEKIKEVLANDLFVEVPVDEMNEEESLRDIFGLDSLGFVELRVQCENIFGVTISDDEFSPENFSSIAAITGLIQRLTPKTTT
ncbi:acyl carrier protein [Saccharopolyspora sp. 5N708]|uniref:acyl carrier protein n=1 Tax=Saccharopolyspora sp. 5N708 TaxID=3457424 RepID=UPI003FD33ECD